MQDSCSAAVHAGPRNARSSQPALLPVPKPEVLGKLRTGINERKTLGF